MLCEEELKIISANDPKTLYHLKKLRERKRERSGERQTCCFFKKESVLYWEKLVGSVPGKVSKKLDRSGTFLIAH